MKTIKIWLNYPLQRRQLLTAASGMLILVGLAADYLAGLPNLYYGLMVGAALLAGSDIALRAGRLSTENPIKVGYRGT
jgi:Cd2+/Zn2+-exporting ATPase